MARTFSRAQGASSGSESWAIAIILIALVSFGFGLSLCGVAILLASSLAFQLLAAFGTIDLKQVYYYCFSQKLGPSLMRNASIGFAECVKPGGKPTHDHALNLYHLSPFTSSVLFFVACVAILTLGPWVSLIRVFYPEHRNGVNSGRYLSLYLLFLRHPLVVQGEGPSNGDGLAAMNAAESLLYPITRKNATQGPLDVDYWLPSAPEAVREKNPRLRDMFHDKVFCHRFFRSHNVACPEIVGEVEDCKLVKQYLQAEKAPRKLIWKPRYSTMGLGVEHFDGWEKKDQPEWAPSDDPYVIEEFLQSTEHPQAEWYRCTTLWSMGEKEPKSGYCWRMRNEDKGDTRVQTDILGGAYCVTKKYEPFVGPKSESEEGHEFDPRTGRSGVLDPRVNKALTTAIEQMTRMHANLGQELWSIGWDVMIQGETPYFLEFNINNGFFVGDHSVEEVEEMIGFYSREFDARVKSQLIDFDPEREE